MKNFEKSKKIRLNKVTLMYQENTINHAFELVPSHSLMLFTLLNEEINTFIRGSFRWYLIMIDNLAILNSLKLDDSSYFRIEYCVSVLIRQHRKTNRIESLSGKFLLKTLEVLNKDEKPYSIDCVWRAKF